MSILCVDDNAKFLGSMVERLQAEVTCAPKSAQNRA